MRSLRIPEDVLYPGNIFYHFKGKFYIIVSVSKHTETGELMVNYKALFNEDSNKLVSRPAEMFLSDVDGEKYSEHKGEKRFRLVLDRNDKNASRLFTIGVSRMIQDDLR